MKILIVTETIGGKGHEKAAQSVAEALRKLEAGCTITQVSLLAIASKSIERLLRFVYMAIIKRFPALWRWMYQRESGFAFLFKQLIARMLASRLRSFFNDEKPDLVIATHAAGLVALARLKEEKGFNLAVIFTDFQVNSFWINQQVDYYFVAHGQFKESLVNKYGIAREKVFITGIPINQDFAKTSGLSLNSNNSRINHFNILIMGGGLGLGGIEEIIDSLNKLVFLPIRITVVTGTNSKLFLEIRKLQEKNAIPLRVFRYVESIHLLLRESDLLITKAGGLTISEALATATPILIYKPIPGQEERNVAFLLKAKAAIRVNSLEYLVYWVQYLYSHPAVYQKLRYREQLIAKPNAARNIAEVLLEGIYHQAAEK